MKSCNKIEDNYKVNNKLIFSIKPEHKLQITLKDYPNYPKIIELVILLKCMYLIIIFYYLLINFSGLTSANYFGMFKIILGIKF